MKKRKTRRIPCPDTSPDRKLYNGTDRFGRLVENGKMVQCPKCNSSRVKAVHPFDYVKQCKKCGKQFSTGVHN
jgi:uncharacterized protein (DUF983 family)